METFSALLVICAGNSPVTSEWTVEQKIVRLVIWDAIALIMTSLYCDIFKTNLYLESDNVINNAYTAYSVPPSILGDRLTVHIPPQKPSR